MDTVVGTGAYATVYKGTWLGRQVAVKVRPCWVAPQQFQDSFMYLDAAQG